MRPVAAKMREAAEKFMQIVTQDTSLSVADSRVVYDTILAAFAAGTKHVFAIEREELESAMLDHAKVVDAFVKQETENPVITTQCDCPSCVRFRNALSVCGKSSGRCGCPECASGATMQTELLMVLDLYAQTHNPTLAQAKMIYDLLLTAYSCGSKRAEPVRASQLSQWLRASGALITALAKGDV